MIRDRERKKTKTVSARKREKNGKEINTKRLSELRRGREKVSKRERGCIRKIKNERERERERGCE